MIASEHARQVLALRSLRGIGNAWIARHAARFAPPETLIARLRTCSKSAGTITLDEFRRARDEVDRRLQQHAHEIDGVVAIGDPHFPALRGAVKRLGEMPVVLFYRGALELLQREHPTVAVIGLTEPEPAIETLERRLVAALVERGATIVSGLARGCDAIAHTEALRRRGTTVAILPSPVSHVLPRSHAGLAEDIVATGGLLISEYLEPARSRRQLASRYVERDRLQALFSDCVVLTASYAPGTPGKDSGSQHAMKAASRYGIPRAVVHDPTRHATHPMFELNRQILAASPETLAISEHNLACAADSILACHARRSARQPPLFPPAR